MTLLFSDIEASTLMLSRMGSHWGEALSDQRSILRRTFVEHGGFEMGTEGDSFFVVFESAHEALHAAVEGQRRLLQHRWPHEMPVQVRMGLHSGEPDRHEDGYIGMDVHRAARIAATASGGQVVVSTSVKALVDSHQLDVGFRDLGRHRLKDLAQPEHLYDLVGAGLPDPFPPLRSMGALANLPTYAIELVGRSTELAEVTAAFESGTRLLTLTGPGGTGKTRLGVAVAKELQDRFPCDLFFVELHAVERAALMWSAVAEAVGAPTEVDVLPHDRAVSFLSDRTAFLVLDNLEQISDADVVVAELLRVAPNVRVLVTSRRPLHLVDEQLYPVSPLALPGKGRVERASAAQTPAVALFLRRARMALPSFTLTDANVAAVVTLCRRLDGLPLAIELAAARSRILSPRAMLSRIDGLAGELMPATDRTDRQRTLTTAIAWSYELLDSADQQIFWRLGVFAGRVDLETIAFVAGSHDRDPLDAVAHLVDVSLLEILEGPDGEPMISMLETIRRFARDRLEASGECEEVRARHAQWCVQVAADVRSLLHGPNQMKALDRMDAWEEDIRAALDWCLVPLPGGTDARRECGYALVEPMNDYWYRFGYVAEGRGWHERALQALESDGSGDSARLVDALHGMGVLAVQQNELVAATHALARALEIAERLGDLDREARECNSLGIARRDAGDLVAARALIERSILLARQVGNPHREATALSNVMHIHMDAGDFVAAVEAGRRSVAADRALGDPWGVAIGQCNLVLALLGAEGPQSAYEQLVNVAADAVALEDVELSIGVLESFAAVWGALGDIERTARLMGASDSHRDRAGIPRTTPDDNLLQRFVTPARRAVSPESWEDSYASGRSLSMAAAVTEGLAANLTQRLPEAQEWTEGA